MDIFSWKNAEGMHLWTRNRPLKKFLEKNDFNSRRKIDHSMVDLVLKALESTDAHIRDYWFLYSRCKILLAFCWYQYFDNLNFLSGFYLSKTRGRSAFFRENYNLNTIITYAMCWNSRSLWNQTFWKRWWPQVLF